MDSGCGRGKLNKKKISKCFSIMFLYKERNRMAKHPLTFGYKASAEQFGPRELLNFAVEAEESGFDSVWISDHFQPWRHTNGHAPFALAWMGALGERTSRIVMGTSVLTP